MATQATTTATVNRVTQIGFEATPGTAVPAVRRLQAGGFDLARETDFQTFRPPGFKFDTQSAKTREWASGSYTGGLAYNEFHILCSSAIRKATSLGSPTAAAWTASTYYPVGQIIVDSGTSTRFQASTAGTSGATEPIWTDSTTEGSTVSDGSTLVWTSLGASTGTAYDWVFDMDTFSADDVQYLTIERGDSSNNARSRRASRARLTGLSVSSARTGEVGVSADVVAGSLETFPLTTGLTDVTMIPATPADLNIYIDDDSVTLGNTAVQGNISGDFALSDRAAATWFHGRSIPGIAGFVETTGMGAEANLTQKDDDLIDELLLALQNGEQRFIRYDFQGPEIGTTGVHHRIFIDMCAQIGDSETESDEDGVFAIQLPYRLQHNGTWGKAFQITVRNGLDLPLS